ncbi:hypothetical protein GCM10027567_27030 [Spongiibacter taiwanensis]
MPSSPATTVWSTRCSPSVNQLPDPGASPDLQKGGKAVIFNPVGAVALASFLLAELNKVETHE